MRNRLILGVFMGLLGACVQEPDIHSPESDYYRQQEAQVLIDLFEEVITPGGYIPLPPSPPGVPAQLPNDTVYFNLSVADRLVPLKEHWYYKSISNQADTSERLVVKLRDSLLASAPILPDVVQLIEGHHFSMSSASKPVVRAANSRPRAQLLFSRVSFNKTFTEACFLRDYGCGSECGGGTLVFAKKVASCWRITKRWNLWVS